MKQKTTKKALRLQAAVYKLKTGRRNDLIKMGGVLLDIKKNNHFRNMEPYFKKWGLYLTYSLISPALATKAIQAYERMTEIRSLTGSNYVIIKDHMLNMHKTNFHLLCLLPATEIISLIELGAYAWTCQDLRSEVYRHLGRVPPAPTVTASFSKKRAAHILDSLKNSRIPRGQKTLRKKGIEQFENMVVILSGKSGRRS